MLNIGYHFTRGWKMFDLDVLLEYKRFLMDAIDASRSLMGNAMIMQEISRLELKLQRVDIKIQLAQRMQPSD